MRSHKNSLKKSIIQVKNTLILQENEDLNNKKSNNNFFRKETKKKGKEEKDLRKAYKNVIFPFFKLKFIFEIYLLKIKNIMFL